MADPVGWRGVTYGSAVFASDGTRAATVHEILGSDAEDIFHGVRARLGGKRDVMITADVVTALTTDGVTTSLSKAELEGLPTYSEAATYHLASVGWLRKHLGWAQDSKSDEEAG
jgi:hypothetical protein